MSSELWATFGGAALGSGVTVASALVVLWLKAVMGRRRQLRHGLTRVCDEMQENNNQLNLILMALGVVKAAREQEHKRKPLGATPMLAQ